MLLKVHPHKIEIEKEPVNERELYITKCYFEFDEEITNDFVKEAYFTFDGETYKQIIVNDECDFPSEVLTKKGTIEIGVVAYLVENEEEIKRYNPSPAYFDTWAGSLKDNAENSEPITPSEMEQFEQALTDGLNDIDYALTDLQEKVDSGYFKGDKGDVGTNGVDGKDAKINGVNTLSIEAGSNITLEQQENVLTINASGGGSSDYEQLNNKPKINNVELSGNKTTSDLGINIPDVSEFITKDVNNLTNYTKTSELSSVATSGSYNDLSNKPTIPTVPSNVSAFTNDAGYLTSYTETDPVFNASASASITNTDITNWNGKQEQLVSGTNIKTIDGYSLLGSGDFRTNWYLGKTALYNTTSNAINLNSLRPGRYLFKHSSSNNTLYIKATYKTSSSSSSQTKTYNLNLFDNLSATKVVQNTIILYIDKTFGESSVAPGLIGSITETYSDSTRGFINRFRGIYLRNTGIDVVTDTNSYEDMNVNLLSLTQTITAKKTFNVLPESSVTPTTNNQLVNKSYVDNAISTAITSALGGSY